ncbi:hypothetical protein [Sulfurospirillum barnesii]|uniref:Uncharacterized protein n=1 Tax=Sulfurospirillum barnesii (strain ATCC 700032 / DSM 10660 / SES-3) TaxID=760154 RepID=I3XY88_SULBS|nr:hypothetical protein [Sulfurospirillum barnesii]AFL68912.1 hypothetical protein Sulba_1624 [Sulfurospirillum barnesii SES-3]
MKKSVVVIGLMSLLGNSLFAHTALMSCMENADATITCEAGFSDGSSAAGVMFKVVQEGKVVFEKKFDENSEITFKKPQGEYTALLDGGDGHSLSIPSRSILK